MAKVAWRFDHTEVRQLARERWGLRWPVALERRSYTCYRQACHWVGRSDPDDHTTSVHHVRLYADPRVEELLRCLAHELEHGAQSERMGTRIFGGWGDNLYRFNPEGWEAGAHRAEERWRELLPAIRPTRGVSLEGLLVNDERSTE